MVGQMIRVYSDQLVNAQSAVLSLPHTCLQQFVDVNSRISDTRFPTKTLNLCRSPHNHPRTMRLSVHVYIFFSGTFSTVDMCFSNLAKIEAPHNSNRGMVIRFIGATFVLATTKLVCIVPSSQLHRDIGHLGSITKAM